ncbi:putative membrane protein YczE [Actinokineospora auranticolor]|uniref:Putative membrane protein YczE n=2 Tax=Actinokineospora auranticolor TaxID=155976 RepID=A0A2S6GH58_9PSEU|nr:putative membrane protein YczE [Actinokineospora auranticolor]
MLHPVPVRLSPGRRLTQLTAGLALYGVSVGMQIEAALGLAPWDVLHEALHKITGWSFGIVTALTSVTVLLCWIPIKQKLGVGTVANVVIVAGSVDLTLAVLPTPDNLVVRLVLLVSGVVLNGLATAAYIGVRLGPGPRDGLMTGVSGRTGWAIRWVRTAIEVTVLVVGWLLGGTVGVGTVLYALGIGPLAQAFLPFVTWRPRVEGDVGAGGGARTGH